MNRVLLILGAALAVASAGPVGPGQRVINDDIDEILGAVNEAVQLLGVNYIKANTQITLSDSSFQDISFGELSSWKRINDAIITGEGLQNFKVETDIGLGSLQFNVGQFEIGAYKAPINIAVLDNSAHLEFHVVDRFQPTCDLVVDSLSLVSFADPRYFTADFLASGFTLEKSFILDHFRQTFLGDAMIAASKNGVQNILRGFLCRNSKQTLLSELEKLLNIQPIPAPQPEPKPAPGPQPAPKPTA